MNFKKIKKLNISYFHIFDCKHFILNNGKDNLDKYDAKSDEGIFLGYSIFGKTYRVFNKCTLVVEESIHMVFDETNNLSSRKEDIADNDASIIDNGMEKLTLKEFLAQDNKENSKKVEGEEETHENTHDESLPKEWQGQIHGVH